MTKAELRKIYSNKRKALSAEDYAILNQQLLAQFKTVDFSCVKYIHIFLPIISRREPDTYLIINYLKANHPNITLVYPQCNFAGCSMESFVDDTDLQLAENQFGITEPVAGNIINPDNIDMILLPLLAFDKRGYRVGYGKGFYDRFIARCRTDVQLVGLSLFEPMEHIDDVNEYDRQMHRCIMPDRVWDV
ncbi:5-formyltetrahydrofolate cyclo-ligase [Mucilaginibacter ginkgonis]|uniref:5-formyltetrahydrofolate cyclo-ligase n=1 Tax=Mucilaginibacter ginkgonis TaxID=2682091 RepID=A0A6I4INM4_9SPHI|nr:5-formyltetrahydrofolate cyclo-ligase [Mucilaginibacter ginkgonis]QQL48856.1 5-formyltetrahydrofolate cyclo-ligase [Mucilaginibacter ginkgonis]